MSVASNIGDYTQSDVEIRVDHRASAMPNRAGQSINTRFICLEVFLIGLPAFTRLLAFREEAPVENGFPGALGVTSIVTVIISSSAACVPCFASKTVGAVNIEEGVNVSWVTEGPVMPVMVKSAV